MKKTLLALALILTIPFTSIVSSLAHADSSTSNGNSFKPSECFLCRTDVQEHMVTSYALTFTSYMVYRKKLEMSPESSALAAFGTGMLLGLVRDKYMFNKSWSDIGELTKANAAGAGLSTVFTVVIQF